MFVTECYSEERNTNEICERCKEIKKQYDDYGINSYGNQEPRINNNKNTTATTTTTTITTTKIQQQQLVTYQANCVLPHPPRQDSIKGFLLYTGSIIYIYHFTGIMEADCK